MLQCLFLCFWCFFLFLRFLQSLAAGCFRVLPSGSLSPSDFQLPSYFPFLAGCHLKLSPKDKDRKMQKLTIPFFGFFLFNRSSAKWLQVFADAGLKVIKEVTQEGMPEELFVVKA